MPHRGPDCKKACSCLKRERRLPSWPLSSPRTLLGSCSSAAGGPCLRPFKDDVGLVADGAPDADVADVLTGFGATQMVSPPFEHRLAAAWPTKQEDPLLARNVDLHFVHGKGATLAKRCYSGAPASPPPTGCGRSFAHWPNSLPWRCHREMVARLFEHRLAAADHGTRRRSSGFCRGGAARLLHGRSQRPDN